MNTKLCRKCNEVRSVAEFSRVLTSSDGLHSHCKRCRREYANRRNAESSITKTWREKEPRESPTAWLLPADTRDHQQRALAKLQMAWRYPILDDVNLAWRV